MLFGATIADGKSTRLIASWKNPEYSGATISQDSRARHERKPGVRADFEDALSKLVTRDGVEAIPGNTILLRPEDTKLDLNYLKTQIREFKIDAVIVSRLVKVETNVTYIPGQPYMMPYPYTARFTGITARCTQSSIRRIICGKTRPCASRPTCTTRAHLRERSSGPGSAIPSIPDRPRRRSMALPN